MRILVSGSSGQLGAYVCERLLARRHEILGWTGSTAETRRGIDLRPVDLADARAVGAALDQAQPDAILHLGAISAADSVRRDPDRGWAVNVEGTRTLARWAGERGRRLVFTSTDLVFDGSAPWRSEDDLAEPILAYGLTKRAAELFVREIPDGLVARVSLLYGPSRCGRAAYFDSTIDALRRGESRAMFEDEYRTPLDLATAALALALLVEGPFTGLVHLAGPERMSRHDLIRRSAVALGLNPELVRANRRADVDLPEPRPADVSLKTDRLAEWLPGLARPGVAEALASFPDLA